VSETPPPLVAGADVVLAGVVRHLEDHDVAVKVNITQAGSESESSGSWSHSWTEIDRDIVLAPFLLELAGGELVRIDPPRNVDVADALDQKVWIDRNERVLSAELVPGETIFARGRLERSDRALPAASAYRDVQWGWALQASDGQMLLSSEPLGSGMRARAAFHRGFAWRALVLLVATQVTLVYYYQRALGDTMLVPLTSKRWYSTYDDGESTTHWQFTTYGKSVNVDAQDYSLVATGDELPIRVADADNWNLGAKPTISWWHGLGLVLVTTTYWVWYRVRRRKSRPWFRRPVNDSGQGRLPDVE